MVDAEQLLEKLATWAFRDGYAHARGEREKCENASKKEEEITAQLLPVVKVGLAMQRLEKFIKRGGANINIADLRHVGDGLGGFSVTLRHGYPATSSAAFSTAAIADAINAAIDAAGAE